MKLILTSIILGFSFSIWANDAYFLDTPTLSPDAETVVFSYQGDLWKVATKGGTAVRLTTMDGIEDNPAISPDGKWIAFRGQQFGNSDVYIMPMKGGEIRQLTYHGARDVVETWSWDSQKIYFTSNRENEIRAFSINKDGGTPKRLSKHYFNREQNIAIHPDGRMFFNESWESGRFLNRKGYKGAYSPNIKSYQPTTSTYKEHTHYNGKDVQPTIDQKGNIYFSSDEYNGELNLYRLTPQGKECLTHFKTSIYHPFVSANGSKIVFRKGYQLWLYDVVTQKTNHIPITITKNPILTQKQDFKTDGNISHFDVATDNEKLLFVTRGELFVSDVKGKFIRQIKTAPSGRVLEAYWLENNKEIIFNQTVNGYQNWFIVAANGRGAEKQITSDQQNNRHLVFNSDKSKAVYLSGREEVRLLNLSTKKSKLLTKQELWGFHNISPAWAPDDRHIVFTVYNNFEPDVYLLDIVTNKVENLTHSGTPEIGAEFSPDGKYLYFIANKTKPFYPRGLKNGRIYRVPLVRQEQAFRSDKFDEIFEEKEDEKDEKEEEKEVEKEKIVLDLDRADFMKRLENIGPRFGQQVYFKIFQKGETTTLIFASNHDEGKMALWKKVMTPFEEPKTEKITSLTGSFEVKAAKDEYYLLNGGNIHQLDLDGNTTKKIAIQHIFQRNLQDEFLQMFEETWANVNENFYNESFHGLDWKSIKKRYQSYLPYISSRRNIRTLLNDMLGELNTSHVGFYSFGKEEELFFSTTTNEVGVIFNAKNPYQVQRIIKNSPADIKGKNLQKGDILVAVNGVKVDEKNNRNQYFVSPSRKKEIKLTFRRAGKDRDIKFHPTSTGQIRDLLYNEWQDQCQEKVNQLSNNRIAHVHMKNMGSSELQLFLEEMVTEGNNTEGLILDLRNNTGGNVHNDVLQFLSQRSYLNWKYRGGKLSPQPHFAPSSKPMVLLINEQSLSDAEMTAAGFKALELGTIIGEETYRWIIFTSGKGLVDGGYRLPSWGCYTLEGENLEQTGVAPDIRIRNTFKDRMKGDDPQLERAVQEILKQLK